MTKPITNSAAETAEATPGATSVASPGAPAEAALVKATPAETMPSAASATPLATPGDTPAVPPAAPRAAATLDPAQISGVGNFTTGEPTRYQGQTYLTPSGKVFLVQNATTVEVRTDPALVHLLVDKYESVMVSRYFGQSGVEIVLSGQLSPSEVDDLIRLSYNLSNAI